MKTLFALLFIASFSSQALTMNQGTQFLGNNTVTEESACIVVAHTGIKAEKQLIGNNLDAALCNGKNLYNFPTKFKQFSPKSTQTSIAKI